jgi:hypothetical protein
MSHPRRRRSGRFRPKNKTTTNAPKSPWPATDAPTPPTRPVSGTGPRASGRDAPPSDHGFLHTDSSTRPDGRTDATPLGQGPRWCQPVTDHGALPQTSGRKSRPPLIPGPTARSAPAASRGSPPPASERCTERGMDRPRQPRPRPLRREKRRKLLHFKLLDSFPEGEPRPSVGWEVVARPATRPNRVPALIHSILASSSREPRACAPTLRRRDRARCAEASAPEWQSPRAAVAAHVSSALFSLFSSPQSPASPGAISDHPRPRFRMQGVRSRPNGRAHTLPNR